MKKYIIAGLLAWLPLAVTIWLLMYIINLLNSVFGSLMRVAQHILPASITPAINTLTAIPGLSIAIILLALFLTGVLVTNMFGQWILQQSNLVVSKIPIVKSIYTSVKQVSDTLFSSSGQAFRQAVLVEYPRTGTWTVAFVTGTPSGELATYLDQADFVSVYVPTTPNPTSGFMLIVARTNMIPLEMTVDEALKYIISMGAVAPRSNLKTLASKTA